MHLRWFMEPNPSLRFLSHAVHIYVLSLSYVALTRLKNECYINATRQQSREQYAKARQNSTRKETSK